MLTGYLVLFAIVLGVNLLPAFGPPTWAIIVLFGINTELPVSGTVLVSALAAATGRFLLALAFRSLGRRAPKRVRRNVAAIRVTLEERRRAGIIGLILFALSPVPSAQLFEAAGLAGLRLVPFTLAFFTGRVVSYAIYATGARSLRDHSLGPVLLQNLPSPSGVAVQLLALLALVTFTRIDWQRLLARNLSDEPPAKGTGSPD